MSEKESKVVPSDDTEYVADPISDQIRQWIGMVPIVLKIVYIIPFILYVVYLIGNFDGKSSDPAKHCWVSSASNKCQKADAKDVTDASNMFCTLLIIGVVISSLNMVNNIWTGCINYLLTALFVLVDIFVSLIWIIVLTVFRFSHSGKVVSGDYCSEDAPCKYDQGEMFYLGLMFYVWVIAVFCVWGLGLLYVISEILKSACGNKNKNKVHKDYLEKYERVGDKPLGAGDCGTAWKIKVKGDESGQFFVGKEFVGADEMCKFTFTPENEALSKIDHPGCVKKHEHFGDGSSGSVLILDFCKGDNLMHWTQKNYAGKALPKDKLIDMCLQMAESIRYVHKEVGYVHRDLHPGNWMVQEDGTVKLIDFGISMALNEGAKSKSMWVFETFSSPEVTLNKGAGYDADLWYFTGVLHTLVHPMHYLPWIKRQMSLSQGDLGVMVGMIEYPIAIKKKVPFPKLPDEVSEYDQFFQAAFDYDITKRPTIEGMIDILKGIKANQI